MEANELAIAKGIVPGMALADARAIVPGIEIQEDRHDHASTILNGLAEWCIGYTPTVAIDGTDGLVLDATGCAHLWGGEERYLNDIDTRLKRIGYNIKAAMADTIGMAWAASRFGSGLTIVRPGEQSSAIMPLPASCLRIVPEVSERLTKLGIGKVRDFISMPRSALRRRFGQEIITRIEQALGQAEEIIQPIRPAEAYQERLPCIEPVVTRTGIEIALEHVLESMTRRLQSEGKGLRRLSFKGYRIDAKIIQIEIGTNRATHRANHLFRLCEMKIDTMEPGPGIELFLLEASGIEDVTTKQQRLWDNSSGSMHHELLELLDRFEGKFGPGHIHRFVPAEHHWPERAFEKSSLFSADVSVSWRIDRRRPVQLLAAPEPIEVTAPIPDYPPMLFIHDGKRHKVMKADGPERIEQEWWLQQGEHRDYYIVEDESGCRSWIFRSGHYQSDSFGGWFLHGYFG